MPLDKLANISSNNRRLYLSPEKHVVHVILLLPQASVFPGIVENGCSKMPQEKSACKIFLAQLKSAINLNETHLDFQTINGLSVPP